MLLVGDIVGTNRFVVTNVADRPVRLQRAYTSCGCTTASLEFADGTRVGRFGMPGHELPTDYDRFAQPGERFEVLVEFNPVAHGLKGIGSVPRSVVPEPAGGPALEFVFTAYGLPRAGAFLLYQGGHPDLVGHGLENGSCGAWRIFRKSGRRGPSARQPAGAAASTARESVSLSVRKSGL